MTFYQGLYQDLFQDAQVTVLEASSLTWIPSERTKLGYCIVRAVFGCKQSEGECYINRKACWEGAYEALGQMFSAAPLGRCICGSGPPVCGGGGGAGPKTAECVPDAANNCCWLQENARNCFSKSPQKKSLAGWSRVAEFSAREVHGYVGHGTAEATLATPGLAQ